LAEDAVLESELIERYFVGRGARRADVALGIGDDAAVLRVPRGAQLIVTTDALVAGVHFLPHTAPRSLGHRALAVNLSDLAAMGADPSWMLLSLVLPQSDSAWLRGFSAALNALARRERVALVGGNLSRGPLSITIALAGLAPRGAELRRDGARVGDDLYVSGTLGDAAAGLELLRHAVRGTTARGLARARRKLQQRFEYPSARIALGRALRGVATACIDVSDGLYVDASRLLRSSGCGADLEIDSVPLSRALRRVFGAEAMRFALTGGEDYELCFTAPVRHAAKVSRLGQRLGVPLTRIGRVRRGRGLTLKGLDAKSVTQFSARLFDHFESRPGRAPPERRR
jgi:thiamine-monophosphate kinase